MYRTAGVWEWKTFEGKLSCRRHTVWEHVCDMNALIDLKADTKGSDVDVRTTEGQSDVGRSDARLDTVGGTARRRVHSAQERSHIPEAREDDQEAREHACG